MLRKQLGNNQFLVSRFNCATSPEGFPCVVTTALMDKQMISRNPGAIPVMLHQSQDGGDYFASLVANLSVAARAYLAAHGLTNSDADRHTAEVIWMHALAMTYSPAYLAENADGIRQDWPRIPLPTLKTRCSPQRNWAEWWQRCLIRKLPSTA